MNDLNVQNNRMAPLYKTVPDLEMSQLDIGIYFLVTNIQPFLIYKIFRDYIHYYYSYR